MTEPTSGADHPALIRAAHLNLREAVLDAQRQHRSGGRPQLPGELTSAFEAADQQMALSWPGLRATRLLMELSGTHLDHQHSEEIAALLRLWDQVRRSSGLSTPARAALHWRGLAQAMPTAPDWWNGPESSAGTRFSSHGTEPDGHLWGAELLRDAARHLRGRQEQPQQPSPENNLGYAAQQSLNALRLPSAGLELTAQVLRGQRPEQGLIEEMQTKDARHRQLDALQAKVLRSLSDLPWDVSLQVLDDNVSDAAPGTESSPRFSLAQLASAIKIRLCEPLHPHRPLQPEIDRAWSAGLRAEFLGALPYQPQALRQQRNAHVEWTQQTYRLTTPVQKAELSAADW